MNLRLSYKSKSSFSFPFFLSVVKLSIIKARQSSSFDKYIKAWEYLEEKKTEPTICNNIENSQRYCMVQAKIFHELAQLVASNPSISHDTRLLTFKQTSTPSAQLFSKAYRTYDKACQIIEDHKETTSFSPQYIAKSKVSFALFCDTMLQKSQSSSDKVKKIGEKYAMIVVSNILESMKLGSSTARDRFPRLLQLLEDFPSTSLTFEEGVKEIPSWMFIRWISQLVGVINNQPESIIPILRRLASDYPQAIYYPFKITSETLNEKAAEMSNDIEKQLYNPLIDEFIEALGKMTHPEHRFKDWAEALKPLVKEKKKY